MILQVFANAGQFVHDRNTVRLEQI